jgi:hypothetical protein
MVCALARPPTVVVKFTAAATISQVIARITAGRQNRQRRYLARARRIRADRVGGSLSGVGVLVRTLAIGHR